jgi:hypothetical protein
MNTAAVTEDHKRQAWRLLRRQCWPDTYEETVLVPIRAQLIAVYAYHLSKATATPQRLMATRPALERAARQPVQRWAPTCTDNKRAAAGDRDD